MPVCGPGTRIGQGGRAHAPCLRVLAPVSRLLAYCFRPNTAFSIRALTTRDGQINYHSFVRSILAQ